MSRLDQAILQAENNGSPNGEPLFLEQEKLPRSKTFLTLWAILALSTFIGFIALGTWQLERRVWKLALIERVESRVNAATIDAPAQNEWPLINQVSHEYLHVHIHGHYVNSPPTFIQASTNLGTGYWVLSPFKQDDGLLVLINRGFVADKANIAPAQTLSQPITIKGLLRLTEPGGSRLRANEPKDERWFSRDVKAIAINRDLDANYVAPYFIDLDSAERPVPNEPIGGLTIISFYNHHLVYAITWYVLALMVAGATTYILREEWKKRHHTSPPPVED